MTESYPPYTQTYLTPTTRAQAYRTHTKRVSPSPDPSSYEEQQCYARDCQRATTFWYAFYYQAFSHPRPLTWHNQLRLNGRRTQRNARQFNAHITLRKSNTRDYAHSCRAGRSEHTEESTLPPGNRGWFIDTTYSPRAHLHVVQTQLPPEERQDKTRQGGGKRAGCPRELQFHFLRHVSNTKNNRQTLEETGFSCEGAYRIALFSARV